MKAILKPSHIVFAEEARDKGFLSLEQMADLMGWQQSTALSALRALKNSGLYSVEKDKQLNKTFLYQLKGAKQ